MSLCAILNDRAYVIARKEAISNFVDFYDHSLYVLFFFKPQKTQKFLNTLAF